MGEWRKLKLSDLCSGVDYGYTASANSNSQNPKFLRITDIVPGYINWDSVPHCDIDSKNYERNKLSHNDIVIARTGATTGYSCYINTPPAAVFASYLVRLKINNSNHARFVAYYLKSPQFFNYLNGVLGDKSAQPNASASTLVNAPIDVPSYTKQEKIASILSSLDDKIELNRKMNETQEEMARAIFKSWFVDFDPVHAKARGEKPAGMPDEIADLFPSEFVHSDQLNKPVPKGWDVVPLKNLIDFNPSRQLRSGSIASYVEMSSLPERGMSIKDFYKREFKSGTKFINGDTLFARITPCLENGKTAYVDCLLDGEIAWGSTEFIVMRSKPDIGNYFSYLVARSDWFRAVAIASMTGSSGRQRASKEALEDLLITAPSVDVFKAFNRIIEKIPEKIKSTHNENQTLAELRDSLLPKLISGEIEV